MITDKTLVVHSAPHPKRNYVVTESGETLEIPAAWGCLKPGDAAVTRILKTLGPSWTAVHKKGRKTFSDGVWAPRENIEQAKAIVAKKRSDPAYAGKRQADLKRRQEKQRRYEAVFLLALIQWLDFHPRYNTVAEQFAEAIARHATPVGSGTVARTERIPIEERAAAAAIAWMRHRTTAYESLKIDRIKGCRREVRRELARQSVKLLNAYRRGELINPETCPLAVALRKTASEGNGDPGCS
ncbi:MAG: DUF2293 domain-containing protein [Desulfobulbaceae bacterium]|nr:DUF2293 domain-containing protein [Desulfobulbaceae bacterium]